MSNAPPAELISDSLPATTRSLLILRLPFTHGVPLSSGSCAFDKQQNPKQRRHFRTFRPRVANPNQASDERSRLAVLWLLGVVAFHITTFAIHLLLMIAVVVVIAHFVIRGRCRA